VNKDRKERGDIIKDIDNATPEAGRAMFHFFNELEMIKDVNIRKFTREVLLKYTPDYFWKIPASTSGKYHLPDECVEGGLVKHVKRVIIIAREMMVGLGWLGHLGKEVREEKRYDYDVVISACILHDILKSGFEGRERFVNEKHSSDRMHPYYVRDRVYMQKLDDVYMYKLPFFDDIMRAIEGHYGFWSVLPQTVNLNEAQSPIFICYMADYLSSRKSIRELFQK
jgi:hypothetical protein